MSAPATPFAPTSARASLPPTGSATPALPPQPAAPAMPRPEDFDILPDLHRLISNVARPDNRDALQDTPGQPKSDSDKVRVEDIPEQAAKVRGKMHRARAAVMALPDIDRSLEDQQEEIADLEAHIARLKATLRGLGQPTGGAADEDTSMTG